MACHGARQQEGDQPPALMLQGVELRPDVLRAATELPTVVASPLTDVGAAEGFARIGVPLV